MAQWLPPYRTFLCSDDDIRELLRAHRSIAMVGLGADPASPYVGVAQALKQRGYRVLPVNPQGEAVLGVPAARDLGVVGEKVEVVVVLPPCEAILPLVGKAAATGALVLWLEPGAGDPEAAYTASQKGLRVVLHRRILAEYEMHFPDDEVGAPE